MEEVIKHFLGLSPSLQIKFLKEGDFKKFRKKEKIIFLKTILKSKLSSKTTASALKILRELNYDDRYFFRKFLYHVDSSVATAARKAINRTYKKKESEVKDVVELLQKRKKQRKSLIKSILEREGNFDEKLLISLLKIDDIMISNMVVRHASNLDKINEAKLARAMKNSVWYVRSALTEILGNRKSKQLLSIIDILLVDRNVDVRLKLIEALGKLASDEAKRHLKKLAEDSHILVKREAKKALVNL